MDMNLSKLQEIVKDRRWDHLLGSSERTGWAGVCRLGEGRGTRKCPHRAGPSGEGDSAPLVDLVPSHFEKHSKRTNSDIHGRKCTAISNKEGTRTQYRLRRFRVKRGIKGRTYRNERGHLACGRSSWGQAGIQSPTAQKHGIVLRLAWKTQKTQPPKQAGLWEWLCLGKLPVASHPKFQLIICG